MGTLGYEEKKNSEKNTYFSSQHWVQMETAFSYSSPPCLDLLQRQAFPSIEFAASRLVAGERKIMIRSNF